MPVQPSKQYDKPKCRLSGTDGNVFALLGACSKALKKAGHADMVKELQEAVFAAGSYDEALQAMMAYVDVH